MARKRHGRCKNKLNSQKGNPRYPLLLRYEKVRICIFSGYMLKVCFFSTCEQGALEAADFKGYQFRTRDSLSCWSPDSMGFNLIENVLCDIVKGERPGAVLVFMTGWDDINSLKKQLEAHHLLGDPNKVLLLACHGSMASSEQVVLVSIVCLYMHTSTTHVII